MILVIVQARMASKRLPGKVLKKIAGIPMIGLLLERLSRAKNPDLIILATSQNSSDDELASYVQALGYRVFRGSEEDVLDRFYQCAKEVNAQHVARVTGDCPLIDPVVVDEMISEYMSSKVDYLSNDLGVATFPDGLDFEIFRFSALEDAWKRTKLKSDREHVSPFLVRSENLKKKNFVCSKDLSMHRWTVDEPADFEKVKNVFEKLYPLNKNFNMQDVLTYFEKYPELSSVNQKIQRNEGYSISLKRDANETR